MFLSPLFLFPPNLHLAQHRSPKVGRCWVPATNLKTRRRVMPGDPPGWPPES